MKLLLCKNVRKLGIVGDIVEVTTGYARNYLVPQGLATEPTEANIRALVLGHVRGPGEREDLDIFFDAFEERLFLRRPPGAARFCGSTCLGHFLSSGGLP